MLRQLTFSVVPLNEIYDMGHQAAVSQLKRGDTIKIVEELIYMSRLATDRE
jgi:hypothetical protein